MKRDAHDASAAKATTPTSAEPRAGFATRVIHAGQAPDPPPHGACPRRSPEPGSNP